MQRDFFYSIRTLGLSFLAMVLVVGFTTLAVAEANDVQEPVSDVTIEEWYSELVPKSMEMWPNEYAAAWYRVPGEPSQGIDIGFTEYAESKVAYLAEDFPRPELLHAVTVPTSNKEMGARIAELSEDSEAIDSGAGPFDGAITQPYDIMDDFETGEVVVVMRNATDRAENILNEAYDFPVEVEKGQLGELAAIPQIWTCVDRANCGDHIRAGIQSRKEPGNVKRCSTGFTVWSAVDGEAQVLSAGHCSEPPRQTGELRYHGFKPNFMAYGKVKDFDFGHGVDVELIRQTTIDFTFRAQIYNTDSEKSMPVTNQGNAAALMLGQTICRAGNTTGRRCGNVQNLNYTPASYNNQYHGFIKFSACSAGGDSGGPVYAGGTAYGIYDGHVPGTNGQSDCSGNGTTSFFGGIGNALNAMNVSLLTQ